MNSSGAVSWVDPTTAFTNNWTEASGNVYRANGNVGIGTNTPTNGKLEVNGAFGSNSIYASNAITATAYNTISDVRVKEIIKPSNSKADLATLMDIQITDYQYIDTLSKGNQVIKKVIAQQVDQVYPLAVTKSITEVVPDIFQKAILQDGWIQLATNLKVGERVKIITETSKEIHEVTAVEAIRFQVAGLVPDSSSLFVYGREVDDFHTVDYEAISMLNVSATQEQQKRIEALEKEKRQQQTKIEALEAELKEIRSLKSRLTEIEALLQSTTAIK